MKKVTVNKDNCICCGACYGSQPDFFTADFDGKSKVIKEYVEDDENGVIEAAEWCPTHAIEIDTCTEKCECHHCHCEECDCDDDCDCECDDCDCDCECDDCDCDCEEN